MGKITRSEFLKNTLKVGAHTVISQAPLARIWANETSAESFYEDDILKRMITANDEYITTLLKANTTGGGRRLGHDFSCLASAYTYSGSKYYHNETLIAPMSKLVDTLLSGQLPDGTMAGAGNLESPPDTAFLVELVTPGALLLQNDASTAVSTVNSGIKTFLVNVGEALAVGGIHTPNHRWVVCSALARTNTLYPNKKYLNRIEDWLGEGIYMDSDGHYPERSQNYGEVEDESTITLARLLNKPALLEYPRKNLDMVYYYMEPNGDLVINDSRRQDQWSGKRMTAFYLHYRYLANRDQNGKFAAIARLIENMDGFENDVIKTYVYRFLEDPIMMKTMPASTPPPVSFEKVFPTSSMLRIRRDQTAMMLFGGTDLPTTVASGRSTSPNFFSYRKGKAILKYMRLSSSFFSTGYFYSDGLKSQAGSYSLYRKLQVPYYQPLPKNLRNAKGDYKLTASIDDRFWSKMDFPNRPVDLKTLETKVTLLEKNGVAELTFDVNGLKGVAVTIELCFKEGGTLSGVTAIQNDNNLLESGTGTYSFGGDSIQFGPGMATHRFVRGLEGERYSTHFGNLRTEGMHVFITGTTPFTHKLTFS